MDGALPLHFMCHCTKLIKIMCLLAFSRGLPHGARTVLVRRFAAGAPRWGAVLC
jgi:hypothetical protein